MRIKIYRWAGWPSWRRRADIFGDPPGLRVGWRARRIEAASRWFGYLRAARLEVGQ